MTREQIDQIIKDAGYPEGIGTFGIDAIRQLEMLSPEAGAAILRDYLATAKANGHTSNPGGFDHDVGSIIVLKLMGHDFINFNTFFAPAPDQRTMGATKDPAEVLRRIELGYAWDGTQVASGAELEERKKNAADRAMWPSLFHVDPRLIRVMTIMGLGYDTIRYTSGTLEEWVAFQYAHKQEV